MESTTPDLNRSSTMTMEHQQQHQNQQQHQHQQQHGHGHHVAMPPVPPIPSVHAPTLKALSTEIAASFLSSLKGTNDASAHCLTAAPVYAQTEQTHEHTPHTDTEKLDDYEGSLATTLLRSSDPKVVAAAKRIFLTAFKKTTASVPSEQQGQGQHQGQVRSVNVSAVPQQTQMQMMPHTQQQQEQAPAVVHVHNQVPRNVFVSTSTSVASLYHEDQHQTHSRLHSPVTNAMHMHNTMVTVNNNNSSANSSLDKSAVQDKINTNVVSVNVNVNVPQKQPKQFRQPPTGFSNSHGTSNAVAGGVKKRSISPPRPNRAATAVTMTNMAAIANEAQAAGTGTSIRSPATAPLTHTLALAPLDSLASSLAPAAADNTRTARRERNRMHARKTRQRKKEHMQCLRERAEELKKTHLQLRQQMNEKHSTMATAGAEESQAAGSAPIALAMTANVEILLKRPVTDIPDPSNIQELPTLYLPSAASGHSPHSSGCGKKRKQGEVDDGDGEGEGAHDDHYLEGGADAAADGINYALLQKDRSKCSPKELDLIRKERNRMHAKRTRDRKRRFMEEMHSLIQTLEDENQVLEQYRKTAATGTVTNADPINSTSIGSVNNAHATYQSQPQARVPTPPQQQQQFLPLQQTVQHPQANITPVAPLVQIPPQPVPPVPQAPPKQGLTALTPVPALVASQTQARPQASIPVMTMPSAPVPAPAPLSMTQSENPAMATASAPVPAQVFSQVPIQMQSNILDMTMASAPVPAPAPLSMEVLVQPPAQHAYNRTQNAPAVESPVTNAYASDNTIQGHMAYAPAPVAVSDPMQSLFAAVDMAEQKRNQMWSIVARHAAATTPSGPDSSPASPIHISMDNSTASSPVPAMSSYQP